MHACLLAHDIVSFFLSWGVRPKVCLPCLVHKARVVTALLFVLRKMGKGGGCAHWFLRRFSIGLSRTVVALGRLRGASKGSKKVGSVCLSHI